MNDVDRKTDVIFKLYLFICGLVNDVVCSLEHKSEIPIVRSASSLLAVINSELISKKCFDIPKNPEKKFQPSRYSISVFI